METRGTKLPATWLPGEPLPRRSVLRIGAAVGFGVLFTLTACAFGGGGGEDDEDDEGDEDDD